MGKSCGKVDVWVISGGPKNQGAGVADRAIMLGRCGLGGGSVEGSFHVGPWLVQPSLNTVSNNGSTFHLEPKQMEVLVCLAQHPGEPQSKESLLRAVWGETFVSDDALTRSIFELRRVFEDDAREPRFIQTIPKRGYRLVAPVEWVNGPRDTPATRAWNPTCSVGNRPQIVDGRVGGYRCRSASRASGSVQCWRSADLADCKGCSSNSFRRRVAPPESFLGPQPGILLRRPDRWADYRPGAD